MPRSLCQMENDVSTLLHTSFLTPAGGLGCWNNSEYSARDSDESYEKLLDFFFFSPKLTELVKQLYNSLKSLANNHKLK